MAGAWGCPHEADGVCTRVGGQVCQPGMRGCVLHRRYVIFDGDAADGLRARAPEKEMHDSPLADGTPPGET